MSFHKSARNDPSAAQVDVSDGPPESYDSQPKSFEGDDLDAIMLIETDNEASKEMLIGAFQHLIDSGIVWKLQGFYGRTAHRLIEQGLCHSRVQ